MLLWTLECMHLFSALFFIFSAVYPGVELLDHRIIQLLDFENFPYYFPQWLHQLTFPPTVFKGELFSISLPTFLSVFSLMIAILMRSDQLILKEIKSWTFIERTDAEAETPILLGVLWLPVLVLGLQCILSLFLYMMLKKVLISFRLEKPRARNMGQGHLGGNPWEMWLCRLPWASEPAEN